METAGVAPRDITAIGSHGQTVLHRPDGEPPFSLQRGDPGTLAAATGVINDTLGDFPIVVWAAGDRFHAYVRQVDGRTLTFSAEGNTLVDKGTGTVWDVGRGLAVEGLLRGSVLQVVPSSTAYDWAWRDFYPDSEFYSPLDQ